MKIPFWKNIISLFFLFTFLFLRIVNIHAITHSFSDEDAQDCELCDLITSSNQNTTLDVSSTSITLPTCDLNSYELKNRFRCYSNPEIKALHSSYFYNKPPPNTPTNLRCEFRH